MNTNMVLGDDVEIGRNVIMEGDITIGPRTRIDHNCIIRGKVRIGADNWIYPNCVVGTGPQHKDFGDRRPGIAEGAEFAGEIRIGDNNVIREFATIHQPTADLTSIGSSCYILSYAHIAHDTTLDNHVVLATRVTLGGHVSIRKHAYIGQETAIHQYCSVGEHAMVGMNSALTKSVLPFALMNRQKFTKINRVGMERNGMTEKEISGVEAAYERGLPILRPQEWYERTIMTFCDESVRSYYPPPPPDTLANDTLHM